MRVHPAFVVVCCDVRLNEPLETAGALASTHDLNASMQSGRMKQMLFINKRMQFSDLTRPELLEFKRKLVTRVRIPEIFFRG